MHSCYLCKGNKVIKRYGLVRDNPQIQVLECVSCGLVFLSSFSHINRGFYESSRMHKGKKVNINMWLRGADRDDQRRYRWLRVLMENKMVLDFGCGAGGFLLRAKEVAQFVAGVELEKDLTVHFKKSGIKVFTDLEAIEGRYDIITLFHVLEHLPDPIFTLKKLSKKLNKDGQLIIEVPNADDALLSLYNSVDFANSTYWSCHLFSFTNSTLLMLIKKTGLKVNYVKQIQRYSLANHLHWLAKGEPDGHKKWHFIDSEELNAAYEKQLFSIGSSDTLIASLSLR